MRHKIFSSFLLVVLLLGLLSAGSTVVKITTLADHDVNLQFLKVDAPGAHDSVTLKSGVTGSVDYVFDNSAELFDLSVFLMKDGKKIANKEFSEIKNEGSDVCILMISSDIIELENPCVVEEVMEVVEEPVEVENSSETILTSLDEVVGNETIESIKDTASQIIDHSNFSVSDVVEKAGFVSILRLLGFVTTGEDAQGNSKLQFVLYVIGVLVLIVLIYFVIRFMRKRKSSSNENVVFKNKIESKPATVQENSEEHTIEAAERRIAQAQKEIAELKKVEEIRKAKKKLAEDQERLRLLQERENQESSE